MRVFIAFLFLLALPLTGLTATHYVPDDFATIQGALVDASVHNGDVIIVRPGTYYERIDFGGKRVTLRSEMGPGATVIDAGNVNSVVTISGTAETVLSGFTLRRGRGVLC